MLKEFIEAWHIRRAARILINRNVTRAMVVSRRDNNAMWSMGEKLDAIAKRIRNGYNEASNCPKCGAGRDE